MKRLFLTAALGVVCVSAFAQGTVLLNNINVGSLNAPVYESDGVTKLSGPQFMAELFAGPSANNLGSIAMTGFLTGSEAGYFLGGTQTINSVVPGATAWIQVDVWNTASGASFGQAQASGLSDSWWQSSIFSVVTGGNTILGGAIAPPAVLTGLGTSPVFLNSVPEPSAPALLSCGLAFAGFGKRLNNSMKAKRRCQSPLQRVSTLGSKINAPALYPAAFAYRVR